MKRSLYALVAGAALVLLAKEPDLFSILKNNVPLGRQSAGMYLVPTNQLLRPWGEQALLRGRPIDLAYDSARNLFAVLNSNGISIWDGSTNTPIGEIASRGASYAGI